MFTNAIQNDYTKDGYVIVCYRYRKQTNSIIIYGKLNW